MNLYKTIAKQQHIPLTKVRDIVMSLLLYAGASYKQAQEQCDEIEKEGLRLTKPR